MKRQKIIEVHYILSYYSAYSTIFVLFSLRDSTDVPYKSDLPLLSLILFHTFEGAERERKSGVEEIQNGWQQINLLVNLDSTMDVYI